MNETLLQVTYKAIDDKRGEDIVVLNMQGISLLADYFVIAEGGSERQVQAIAREIKEKAEEAGYTVRKIEGFDSYYNLERLWGDAPQLDAPQL